MRSTKQVVLALTMCLLVGRELNGQVSAENACGRGTWANCGNAVIQALNNPPNSPAEVLRIAGLWGSSYEKEYDVLRRKGQIEESTPNAAKIREAIASKLNPIDIAKDRALDAAVKRYFPMVAPVLEWAATPLGQALAAFFTSTEIATDYDELRLMNDGIQDRVLEILGPSLKPDWQAELKRATTAAAPELRPP